MRIVFHLVLLLFWWRLCREDSMCPLCALPWYHRAQAIKLHSKNKLYFLWCDHGFYNCIGILCTHIFHVVDEVSLNFFISTTGDSMRCISWITKSLDNSLYKHKVTCQEWRYGCSVDYNIAGVSDDCEKMTFGENTNMNDWIKATYVLGNTNLELVCGKCLLNLWGMKIMVPWKGTWPAHYLKNIGKSWATFPQKY